MNLFKKEIYIKPFYLLYIFNLIIVFGIVFGLLPRETIIGAAFLIFFYLFLMKLENCLLFFLASIPFFVALPITREFDSLNIWRIVILIIFGRVFFTLFPLKLWFKLKFIKTLPTRIYKRLKERKLEFWAVAYFLIALLSVSVAQDKGAALKRLIYIFQMALIYPIFLDVVKDKQLLKKAIYHLLLSAFLVLIIGLGQLSFVYFASLGGFWNWWVGHFSLNFYGYSLAKIVSQANTWFSYYPGRSPTLRMFSTFTDSHSFALYLVLASPLALWFSLREYLKKKKINWRVLLGGISFFLMQFSIALSGTRGIWISVAAPIILAFYFLIKKVKLKISQPLTIGLVSFIGVLLLSSLFLSIPQFNAPTSEIDKSLTLKRLKSVIDLEEMSNQGRLAIWKKSLLSIAKKPVLGVGIGNFPVVLGEDVELQKAGSTAHSVYLNTGVEMGVLGLVAIVMLFYEILKKCYWFLRDKSNSQWHYLSIFLGFYFLWAFVYSFFDIAIFDARVMMFFVAEIAIVSALFSKAIHSQ